VVSVRSGTFGDVYRRFRRAESGHRPLKANTVVYGVLIEPDGMGWPSRNQMMPEVARHIPVVILEKAAASQQLFHWRKPTLEEVEPNLFLAHDAFALRHQRVGRRLYKLTSRIDGRWFRRMMRTSGLGNYLVWLTVPDPVLACDVPDKRLIFDCVDPNFLPARQAGFDRTERRIASRSRLVFATAKTLFLRMSAINDQTFLLPNAAPTRTHGTDPHSTAEATRRDVVGYLGTIDWRFDAKAVYEAARTLPDTQFAIVGRVNSDQIEHVRRLRALPNVTMPGQVSDTEGDAYVKTFSVGLIPFTPSSMNDAINPVKMYMYLAEGIPVVATAVAECMANPFVRIGTNHADFAEQVRRAIEEDTPTAGAERRAFARENTWRHRADEAVDILRQQGLLA
jgi:glycosyltransferase involved in cell wall biosynthesis